MVADGKTTCLYVIQGCCYGVFTTVIRAHKTHFFQFCEL